MWKLKLLVSVILISLCVVSWKYERIYTNKVFDLNVSASTYATKDIGDRVCFTKVGEKVDNNYPEYTYTISTIWFIFNFIITLGTFIVLIIFICEGNKL